MSSRFLWDRMSPVFSTLLRLQVDSVAALVLKSSWWFWLSPCRGSYRTTQATLPTVAS